MKPVKSKPDNSATLRALAATVIYDICHKQVLLDVALEPARQQLIDHDMTQEQALLQEMVYGTLRWYDRLQGITALLLRKPIKAKDGDIQSLLLLGLYQLTEMRISDYAAVDNTVAAATVLKKDWAKTVINACLRRFQRDKETLISKAEQQATVRHNCPQWLLQALQQDWPQMWQQIVVANNARPPMTLRINRLKTDRQQYQQLLAKAGHRSMITTGLDHGLILQHAISAELLPGFSDGLVSIQDASAQLAADLLALQPGQRVLDACAAPGGKTTHILEATQQQVHVTAIDKSPRRIQRLQQNLQRLQVSAECIEADACFPEQWWNRQPYDRILLDAPCSASGIIRRHPDIKRHRDPSSIQDLVAQQEQLLRALWPLLKPGGKLLYVTCSVLADENDLQVASFLAHHSDATPLPLSLDWAQNKPIGMQILPGTVAEEGGRDGFYYALLQKNPMS